MSGFVIVDYGMGNLGAVQHKLKRIGIETEISASADVVGQAAGLILPGIGHFARGMANLRAYGLIPVLEERVLGAGVPLLGICLGMQLLTRHSEEGDAEGLGWMDAVTKRFDFEGMPRQPRVPHLGWNRIQPMGVHPWLGGVDTRQRFYFAHSYHVVCNDAAMVLATSEYGTEFAAVVQQGNLYGVQFHPEKSHTDGIALLRKFFTMAAHTFPVTAA